MENFKKQPKLELAPPSSIKLTPEQAAFIKEQNINLSAFVRAQIEELMSQASIMKDEGETLVKGA